MKPTSRLASALARTPWFHRYCCAICGWRVARWGFWRMVTAARQHNTVQHANTRVLLDRVSNREWLQPPR